MDEIQILVVDDHSLFRRGLVGLLDEMQGIHVVGDVSNGQEALSAVKATAPDLVLLDVHMPVMNGVETVSRLRSQGFQGRIIMLTVSQKDEDLLGAIAEGADGYLLKNIEPADLKIALTRSAAGMGVLSPEVTQQVMDAVGSPLGQPVDSGLSAREIQVLEAIARGCTNAEVAELLTITQSTVKTHVRHILKKLEAKNRSEAVRKAHQLGILSSS